MGAAQTTYLLRLYLDFEVREYFNCTLFFLETLSQVTYLKSY